MSITTENILLTKTLNGADFMPTKSVEFTATWKNNKPFVIKRIRCVLRGRWNDSGFGEQLDVIDQNCFYFAIKNTGNGNSSKQKWTTGGNGAPVLLSNNFNFVSPGQNNDCYVYCTGSSEFYFVIYLQQLINLYTSPSSPQTANGKTFYLQMEVSFDYQEV